MDYEFRNIESLIWNAISSGKKSKTSLNEQFANARKAVAGERTKAKKLFAMEVLSFENVNQAKYYVQYHQNCLVKFIDELFALSRHKTNSNQDNSSRLATESFFFCDQVEEILDFVQAEFPIHFNPDAKLPDIKKERLLQEIKRSYSGIEGYLSLCQADPKLLKVLRSPIENALSGSGPMITYRRIQYFNALINKIQEIAENKTNNNSTNQLHEVLLSLNFNSPDYFKYHVNSVRSDLTGLDSDLERQEKLAFYFKEINQIQSSACLIYESIYRPIKEQLSEWLLEEIQFLEKKRRINTPLRSINEEDFTKKNFKLEFDMSVSQLAYFIKAFVESGVIQNKNTAELMRFLSKFVKSRRSESVGYESFKAKYYNVENSTKDFVKNLLHTTIGYINGN